MREVSEGEVIHEMGLEIRNHVLGEGSIDDLGEVLLMIKEMS